MIVPASSPEQRNSAANGAVPTSKSPPSVSNVPNSGHASQEDINYTLLEQANKKIQQKLSEDEKYPELYEQLLDQKEPHNYFLEPYQSYWKPQIVRKGGINEMPAAIISAYERLKHSSMAGLLPEIHHAWISIDNVLFLWDYTKKDKYCVFNEISQPIVSVGLAKPKKDVFKGFVKYVLAISTVVEVTLVAVLFENDDFAHGDIRLRPSKLTIPTDNIRMSKIVGTNSGRIFMAGEDGGLHEFMYDSDESLLYHLGIQKKCRKVDHTEMYLHYLPSFMTTDSQLSGKLLDVVVDEERQILYTLSSSSVISVYDLSVDGQDTKYLSSKNVFTEGQRFCRQYQRTRSSCPDELVFRNLPKSVHIVALSVIPRRESSFIHLIATSNTGIRFYFTTYNRSTYNVSKPISTKVRPVELFLTHVRLPPPATSASNVPEYHVTEGMQPGFVPGKSPSDIRRVFYAQGVLLLANGSPDHHDSLVAVAQDFLVRNANAQATTRKPVLRESVSSEPCHGKIWQIVEFEHPTQATSNLTTSVTVPASSASSQSSSSSSSSAKRKHSDISTLRSGTESEAPSILGELALQYCTPQRLFLCLTNSGVHLFKKLRPIDQLHRVLMYHRNDYAQLDNFYRYYGQTQLCSMLFALACSLPTDPGLMETRTSSESGSSTSSSAQSTLFGMQSTTSTSAMRTDDQVRKDAMNAIFYFGGNPGVSEYAPPLGPGSGRLVMTNDLYFSGHHDGLVLFIGSILRPVWNKSIVIATIKKEAPSSKKSLSWTGSKAGGASTKLEVRCRYRKHELQKLREILFQLRMLMEQAQPYAMAIQTKTEELFDLDNLSGNSNDGVDSTSCAAAPSRANMMTRKLQVYSTSQRSSDNVRQENAIKAEQRSLKSVYNLILRCIEGLSFLLIGLDHPAMFEEKKCIRMAFSDFVLTESGVTCGHAMIHRLLQRVLKERNHVDDLVAVVRKECPSFFSVGDVWQYQGHQVLMEAKGVMNPHQKQRLLAETLRQFMKASVFWDEMECIDMLSKISREYIHMKFFEGVLSLALHCASHGNSAVRRTKSDPAPPSKHFATSKEIKKIPFPEFSLSREVLSSWKDLTTQSISNGNSNGNSTANNSIVNACLALITSNDDDKTTRPILFRMACYNHILIVLYALFGVQTSSAELNMIDLFDGFPALSANERERCVKKTLAAALSSEDALFHYALYSFLLDINQEEILVDIRSQFVERFLKRQRDELLCNYFVRQGRYAQAAVVMWDKAHFTFGDSADVNINILANNPTIEDRLKYLTRALSYAQSATAGENGYDMGSEMELDSQERSGFGSSTKNMSINTLSEIRERLDVVKLQSIILSDLKSETDALRQRYSQRELQASEDMREREKDIAILTYRLVDVSQLYNNYAYKYEMWENCLLIMHSCSTEENAIIQQHWKRILYQMVPSHSINPRNTEWLQDQAQQVNVEQNSSTSFEDANWIGQLQQRIRVLGRKLYGSGADFVFPLDFLIKELESLWLRFQASSENSLQQQNWIIGLFREVKVPFATLFEVYVRLYREQGSTQWSIHMLQVLCEIGHMWQSEVMSSRCTRQDQVEFASCCPKMVSVFEEFTTDLQAMHGDSSHDKAKCLSELQCIKQQLLEYREQNFG